MRYFPFCGLPRPVNYLTWTLLVMMALTSPSTLTAQKLIVQSGVENRQIDAIEGYEDPDYLLVKGESPAGTFTFRAIHPASGAIKMHSVVREQLTVLGYSASSDAITVYFSATLPGYGNRMECLTFSKSTQKFTPARVIAPANSGKKHLSSLHLDGKFLLLSLQTKHQQLILDTYHEGELIHTKEFSVRDEQLCKHFKKNTFEYIPDVNEIPFEQAQSQHKSYAYQNKMLLISDDWQSGESAQLMILSLDLRGDTIEFKTISLPYESKVDHNSFLRAGSLFVLGIDKTMLSMSVYDVNSWQKITEYKYLKGEPIPWKTSDLISNHTNLDEQWRGHWTEAEIARYTLKELNGGTPVISVSEAGSNHIRLLIGNNSIPRSGGGGMMMPTGGGSFSTPGGTVSTPVRYHWTPAHYGGSVIKKSFFGYLGKSGLSHPTETFPNNGNFDCLEKRSKQLSREMKLGGQGIINASEKVYFVYINKQNKTLSVESFQ